jgi:NAD(P)-dependent dehydrogenase (short-subunit alcohol dehydrogenase family)
VNVSSVAGRVAPAAFAAYAATKWGINGWSEALRVELQPDVRVIVIVRPEGFKKLPANGAIELSGSETAVPRGHSRALSDVPSSGASAGRIRLVHADSSRL